MRNELGPIIWVHNNWFKASLSKNTELVRRVLWTTSLCLTRQDKHSPSHRWLGALPPPAAQHAALRSSRRRLHRPNPLERYEHTADRRRRSPRVQRAAGGSTRRCLHQLRLFPPADRRQPATTPPAAAARPTLRRRSRRPRSHCHRVAPLAALHVVADHLPLEHRRDHPFFRHAGCRCRPRFAAGTAAPRPRSCRRNRSYSHFAHPTQPILVSSARPPPKTDLGVLKHHQHHLTAAKIKQRRRYEGRAGAKVDAGTTPRRCTELSSPPSPSG